MRLIGVQIQGFRRFGDVVNVRLIESLIAVVGQNEAGKTSFLDALTELNNKEPIADRDQTRRLDVPTEIEATFELGEEDWDAVDRVPGGEEIDQCRIRKSQDGELSISLDPKPSHDLGPRSRIRFELEALLDSKVVDNHVDGPDAEEIRDIIDLLYSDEDYLGDNGVSRIDDLKSKLDNITRNLGEDVDGIESLERTANRLGDLADHERSSPPERARSILLDRRPRFLIFDDEDRDLSTTYDLKEVATNPPPALRNLAALAELDLSELKDAAVSENIPYREDLLDDANRRLQDEFSEAWVRSDVVPILGMDGTILHLLVTTPGEQNRSRIDERSDGLRWFIALIAFLNQRETSNQPVLLVDEAESHLSYDAQADLIEVLETQVVAQKVIYTTHSAGCLPSDLGTGIRPVITLEGERSEIKNGFWVEGPGFKPLMLAMGASPFAFSVARNALIAEGPSETILLPTLIRQAMDVSKLEFQVAPGMSIVGSDDLPGLLSETGQSAIILDGDASGEEDKQALIDDGVDPAKVRTYRDFTGEPLIFEDFINPVEYVEAVNDELQTYQNPSEELSPTDLPNTGRATAVEGWCYDRGLDPVVKPNVCQRLVEKAAQGGRVVDEDREQVLQEIYDWAEDHFVLMGSLSDT